MIKRVPTNECVIEVTPRSAGDYGMISISGVARTPKDEYRFCDDIAAQIKRHVDGVSSVQVVQTHKFETDDGEKHDTLYEALEYKYGDENDYGERYRVYYRRNNEGHQSMLNTFRDVITEAYRNPEAFEVKSASPPLSEGQKTFLANVLAAALAKV